MLLVVLLVALLVALLLLPPLLTLLQVLVADFYATWCPPCKIAAPFYGKMSKAYPEELVVFAKVDVDACSAVSREERIQSMPTFRLYWHRAKASEVMGWRGEAHLKGLIDGVLAIAASDKTPRQEDAAAKAKSFADKAFEGVCMKCGKCDGCGCSNVD